ncbi:hypothetical protein RPMA_27140 [Tardiphaga alba]|jgi:hypothetical protein|uniref:Uncharacterized protein n=1 Tax=Tardiphaga alba TaxID=340268 RepID=A0ABX8AEC3_9BRAD|nr:hypothetical protein [Tardiphaga alba]OYU92032.1 MAG: hypothetical protein CFE29_04120 [Bradyrhizobiaceae bacterium PARB1]QUS42087.1 hypothetical protein RPMA_27140 [Tardiphaga alba]
MDLEVKAAFRDRRAAEIALEHLVQEIGLERTDIFIAANGAQNTSGSRQAGADVHGSLAESRAAAPVLEGEINMSVGCDREKVDRVAQALRDAGGEIR